MKTTFFELGKKAIFLQFIQHPADSIDMNLACIFGEDQNVLQVNNYKNVKFFGQDFINVTLEAGWCVQ